MLFSPFTYGDKPPLRWHIGWASADTELGLQGVEVRFQASLLLGLGWLGLLGIATELLKVGLRLEDNRGWSGEGRDGER